MSNHETDSKGEESPVAERGEALSPLEQKIQTTISSTVELARALADRDAPGVSRHVIAHKDGTFKTEIFGLAFAAEPQTGARSRVQVGNWMADTVHVSFASSEDGTPLGQDATVHVDIADTRTMAHVDQPGSANDGKVYYKNTSRITFSKYPGRNPSSYSTVTRNGNFFGDRHEYDQGAHDVTGPIDSVVAEILSRGAEFIESTPVTNDLVAKVAAERAKSMLAEQEAARLAVVEATEMPRFVEPDSWTHSGSAKVDTPQRDHIPPPRDFTGYRLDGYTPGRVVSPQPLSASFKAAYPEYADRPRSTTLSHAKQGGKGTAGHRLRTVGRRIKNAVKGKKPTK